MKREARGLEDGEVWALTSNTAGPGDANETYFLLKYQFCISHSCVLLPGICCVIFLMESSQCFARDSDESRSGRSRLEGWLRLTNMPSASTEVNKASLSRLRWYGKREDVQVFCTTWSLKQEADVGTPLQIEGLV